MGGNWKFKPGLSAGMAFGNISYSGSATGSESWNGFAWEISAPFVYNDYVFAIKYAGFPTGSNSDEWNTFGLSAGLRFSLGGGASSSRRDYDNDEYRSSEQEAKRDFKPTQEFEEAEEFVPDETYEGYIQQADDLFSKESYMEAAGKYTGALKFVGVNDPRRIYVLERQGTALGKAGKFEEGIKLYMAAIKVGKKLKIVNRDVINAYLGLSYCQTKIGNIPWAIINYKSARKLTKSESLKFKIDQVIEGLESKEEGEE